MAEILKRIQSVYRKTMDSNLVSHMLDRDPSVKSCQHISIHPRLPREIKRVNGVRHSFNPVAFL
jgi:hypothetical protein